MGEGSKQMDTEHCLLQSDRFLKLYILSNLHIPYTILSLPIEANTLLILFVRVSQFSSHQSSWKTHSNFLFFLLGQARIQLYVSLKFHVSG